MNPVLSVVILRNQPKVPVAVQAQAVVRVSMAKPEAKVAAAHLPAKEADRPPVREAAVPVSPAAIPTTEVAVANVNNLGFCLHISAG